jgi:hypothetical protein
MTTLSSWGVHELIDPVMVGAFEICGFISSRSVSRGDEDSSIAIKPGDDSGTESLKGEAWDCNAIWLQQ